MNIYGSGVSPSFLGNSLGIGMGCTDSQNLPREVVDFQEALSSLLPEWCHCSIASNLTQLTLETPRKKTLAGTFRKTRFLPLLTKHPAGKQYH